MAKEGKKLELYEILAAKRAKGKMPQLFEQKQPQEQQEPELPELPSTLRSIDPTPPPPPPIPAAAVKQKEKVVIVDDAVDTGGSGGEYSGYSTPAKASPYIERSAPSHDRDDEPVHPQRSYTAAAASVSAISGSRAGSREKIPGVATAPVSAPPAEPKVRKPREVNIALDSAFIIFIIIVALVGSSYFLGYKRGQEERPAGPIGLGDIENASADHVNLRHLSPASRATVLPPDQDYTLVLRTEPATEDLPERLEYELAEAIAKGSQQFGSPVQGFIFLNSTGNDARFVLAVGLARTPNDADLNRLMQIYNSMEGITLSRESRPYIGCQIAPIRELGRLVE